MAWELSAGTFPGIKELVDLMVDVDLAWLCVDVHNPVYRGWEFWSELKARVHGAGRLIGIWGQNQTTADLCAETERAEPDFSFPCVESRVNDAWIDPMAYREQFPDLDIALETDFVPYYTDDWVPDPARAKRWIDANINCAGEAYENYNAPSTPLNMVVAAKQRGWPGAVPLIGLTGDDPPYPKTFADYVPGLEALERQAGWCMLGVYMVGALKDEPNRSQCREFIARRREGR